MNEQSYTQNRTIIGGTDTCEGVIPHKRMTLGGQAFDAPVALETKRATREQPDGTVVEYAKMATKNGSNIPLRGTNGGYLYAMPGGSLSL